MKITVTLLFLIVSILSLSQIDKTVYGKEYANNKKDAFNGFIGETQIVVYGVDYSFVNKKKHELTVRKYYKKDLMLVDSKNIYSNPLEDYYSKPIELFFVKNKFYLFSELRNTKEERTVIGLTIFNEEIEEISFAIIDTVANSDKSDLEIREAKDKTGFIILKNYTHKVANRQAINLQSINLYGKVIWTKELLSTNNIHNIKIEKVVHLQNETYILCNNGYRDYANSASSNQNILANKYVLWVYNPKLNFMKEVILRLKGKWINGVDIALNSKNELAIAGYVNSSRSFGINASFNLLLDSNYDLKEVNYNKFTQDDFSKFITVKDMSKIKSLEDFFLRDLVMLEDGSFYLLGEMYYKYVDRSYDQRTNVTTTTDHYSYNSIIVSYFDKNGKLMWHEHVPKFQNSTNDYGYYSSFSWINSGDNLALFYNGNEKNLELNVTDYFNHKELYNNRRHAHTYVILNKGGVVKRSKFNTERTNYILYPKQSFSINKNTMYLMSEYGKYSKIISVSFK
jgi:hypothetical protein